MRKILGALLAMAALFASPAYAQHIVQPREGVRPAAMVQPVYTDADRAAGVQGDVTVRGMVQPDGAIADVVVSESSRSPALDEASVAAVRQWTFPPVETPVPYEVQIEYRKDDLNTLATKTCTDLNIDVAYFRQTFPEQTVADMPLKDVLVGLMLVMGSNGMTVEGFRRYSAAYERTVEWCSTRSDELMLERYLRFAR